MLNYLKNKIKIMRKKEIQLNNKIKGASIAFPCLSPLVGAHGHRTFYINKMQILQNLDKNYNVILKVTRNMQ